MGWNPQEHQVDWQPGDWQPELASGAAMFDGPTIENLTLVQNVAIFPRDFSPRFSGAGLTFSLVGGPVPGLSLSAAGVLSGTPTTLGTTAGLVVRATDGVDTADSNAFSISVVASLPAIQRAGFVANAGRMMAR